MKKLLLLISIFLVQQSFAQKPLKLDSTKLIDNKLYDYYQSGGQVIIVYRGEVVLQPGAGITLDANRNLVTGLQPSLSDAVGNTVLVDNVQLTNSHNNLIAAKNIVVNGSSGIIASGADHTVYPMAHYSAVFNDANQAGGESSLTGGFGNYNFNSNSFVFGNNNVAGNLSKSLVQANLYTGGALIGTNLRSQGNNITMIGYSFNSTVTGFHVGYGKDMFSITPDNKVWINGVPYTFPSNQGSGFLVNDGQGNLSWSGGSTSTRTINAGVLPDGRIFYKKAF